MIHELESFITVAERKNYSEAAKQLNIQQPGLSRQISKLENELHVRLFERTTRSVELTTAGKLILPAAEEFYRQCHSLPEKSPMDSVDEPRIVIGVGDIIEQEKVPEIFNKLIKKNPNIRISIQRYPDTELMKHFYNGDIDFAEAFIEMLPNSSAYEYVELVNTELKVAVWVGHPLANKQRVTLEDLRNEWFVMNSALPDASRDCIYKIFADANFVPKIGGQTNDSRARYMMVGAKQGIAITCVSNMYEKPANVKFLDLDIENTDLVFKKLVLVWDKEHCNKNPHTKKLINLLKKEF